MFTNTLSAQADTGTQASLQLELVANASNPNAYQLHLCDTDIYTCPVALLDAQGNAATIYPHALQRSFFTTYKGYALLLIKLLE
ncbi:MAG: hypothetical protein OYH77_07020 [Pseudomonadota bacterium]|nr:hypothetical protein [Pseudomonadota bacterium]